MTEQEKEFIESVFYDAYKSPINSYRDCVIDRFRLYHVTRDPRNKSEYSDWLGKLFSVDSRPTMSREYIDLAISIMKSNQLTRELL